jgi:hypothetical protein
VKVAYFGYFVADSFTDSAVALWVLTAATLLSDFAMMAGSALVAMAFPEVGSCAVAFFALSSQLAKAESRRTRRRTFIKVDFTL